MRFWQKSKVPQRQSILEGQDEFNAKMDRIRALSESDKDEAIALVSDDSYYVAEKAIQALLSFGEPAASLITILETGTESARIMSLQAARQLADQQPNAIGNDFTAAAAKLLYAADGDTRFSAAQTMLYFIKALPDQAENAKEHLRENLLSLYPAVVDRFPDKAYSRSEIARCLADICACVPATVDEVVGSLNASRPAIREGMARTICNIEIPADRVVDDLERLIATDPDWSVRAWAAAAWEAVTGRTLPVERWPVVGDIWRMVFFESDNADHIPAGARFREESPLIGVLKREGDSLWLYWPDDHGVTSSERLLDDYQPLLVDELADDVSDLLRQHVEITGTYRNHRISAETIKPWRRRSGEGR